jgi:RNA polymerase sigma factor (sigma-70 family)
MSGRNPSGVLRDIGTLYNSGTLGVLTDKQLLDRFVNRADPSSDAAFTILVERHGPMVWGVCRRVLSDQHAAADAFQATFLVLVRRASALKVDGSLAPWLYGVSRRVAARARATSERQKTRDPAGLEAIAAPPNKSSDPDDLELLDQEIARLPERQRATVILCDLEGKPHEEAARRLGCPVGTIESRLSRARQRLRNRLIRRGLDPASAPLFAQMAREATAAIPTTLINQTARLVTVFPASAASAALALAVATLAQGVIQMIWLAKLKPLAALAATLILATTGVAVQQRQNAAPESAPPQSKPAAPKPAVAPAPAPISPEEATNRALAREQLTLIDSALERMYRLAQNGRLEFNSPAFSIWESRRLDALRKAGATKAEIVAALERSLKFMESQEEIAKAQFRSARASEVSVLDVRFRRLQTQIWLNEERAR